MKRNDDHLYKKWRKENNNPLNYGGVLLFIVFVIILLYIIYGIV